MKKIIVILFIISSVIFLVLNKQYALTGYKIPLFSVPNGQVRIDFINRSNENIKYITLVSHTHKIENIKVGERRTITFDNAGEGIYKFIVYLEI